MKLLNDVEVELDDDALAVLVAWKMSAITQMLLGGDGMDGHTVRIASVRTKGQRSVRAYSSHIDIVWTDNVKMLIIDADVDVAGPDRRLAIMVRMTPDIKPVITAVYSWQEDDDLSIIEFDENSRDFYVPDRD